MREFVYNYYICFKNRFFEMSIIIIHGFSFLFKQNCIYRRNCCSSIIKSRLIHISSAPLNDNTEYRIDIIDEYIYIITSSMTNSFRILNQIKPQRLWRGFSCLFIFISYREFILTILLSSFCTSVVYTSL